MAAWPTRTRGGRSNSRTRAGNYGGTSTTCSPTPTSRWASIAPISSLPRRPRSVARTSSPTRAEVCADGDPHRRGSCQRVSKRVHGDRSVGQLVPFDPDDEHVVVPVLVGAFVGRAYLMRVAAVPPRATPGQDVDRRSVRSQANLTAAGHSRGTPDQNPDARSRHVVARHAPSGHFVPASTRADGHWLGDLGRDRQSDLPPSVLAGLRNSSERSDRCDEVLDAWGSAPERSALEPSWW